MSDDRKNTGEPDRSRISLSEDYEVAYWTNELGISREELQRIVEKVGNTVQAVREELSRV